MVTTNPFPLGNLELGKFIEATDLDENTKGDLFHHAAPEWPGLTKERFE